MNFILKLPSLKHVSLTKTAILMWNQEDIRALIENFDFSIDFNLKREQWQMIENEVIEKALQLSLPAALKEEVLGFIKPIGLQVLEWLENYWEYCDVCRKLPDDICCWTSQGTVDKQKTAEMLIKYESFNIINLYQLACIYCLEGDIPKMWNTLSGNHRKCLCIEKDFKKIRHRDLVILWTFDIQGKLDRLNLFIEQRWPYRCSPYQYALEYAVGGGNKTAAEYFLQKLTPEERAVSLPRSAKFAAILKRDDVLCFLLSQMDEQQQMDLFKIQSYKVLKCLLKWPWQSFFMRTANRMWDFLNVDYFYRLLRKIIGKVIGGYRDCNYQKLFGEFWQQSPDSHKKCIIGDPAGESLLSALLVIEDLENIQLILKEATLMEKEKIIFSHAFKDIFRTLIFDNKWNFLRLFVQECVSSKEAMIKFKDEFKKFVVQPDDSKDNLEKDIWNKFFQLMDDLILKDNKKRSVDEGESSAAKRLYCDLQIKSQK